MAQSSYQLINLTGDISLSWPFSFQGGAVVADINNINPTSSGFKIAMPNATLASSGQNIIFNNISAFSFQIVAFDNTTSIVTIAAGQIYYLYLSNSSTTNGSWIPIPFGGGSSNINSVTAQSSDSSITITGSPLSPPGGTINFKLPTSIQNLNTLADVGFPVVKSTSPLTWTARDILGGSNISVSNASGVADDPIISLNPVVTNLSSVEVGDLTLSGSVITTDIVNGGVQLSSAGTGKVQINGLSIDTSANITGVNNLTVGGTFNNPRTPKVLFTFTDTLTPGPSHIIVTQDSSNVSTITGSGGIYTITFTTALSSTNYGVFFGLGSTGGSSPLVTHAFWTLKTVNAVTIAVVDASGVLVTAVPNGITGMIMLTT